MSGDTPVPPARDCDTIAEIVRDARNRMSTVMWDIASGGVESEATLRRNRSVMEAYAFQPRVLRGVVEPDLTTTVLGQQIASPVMLAPVGSIALFHPDGALAPARVAAKRGTISVVGALASPALAEVAAASSGPLIFQIYVRGDREWLHALVRQAEDAGYLALCLTVDSTGESRREREIHNRYRRVPPPQPNLPPGRRREEGVAHQVRFTWDDLDWLRSVTSLPIILKGIINPADAALAVEHGVDAVYVSNHGARELDHLPSSLEMLEEVHAAVAGQAEILIDSGFLRGTDVVKALALGARAVLIGKLQLWGLAAAGTDGLARVLDILDAEIAHTMQLLGAHRVADLSRQFVRPSRPTRYAGSYVTEYTPSSLPLL